MKTTHGQCGFGHIGFILLVVTALVVGFGGWYVWKHQQKTTNDSITSIDKAVADAIKNAKCDYSDKDLCKFFTGWKEQKYATITSKSTGSAEESTTVLKIDGSDKSHLKVASPSMTYEVITMGKTTYTKALNGTWWKQTALDTDSAQLWGGTKPDLEEPSKESSTQAAKKTSYKNLGKEKCGNFTCFKYQVIDPSNETVTSYIWFDDKEYQMRRTLAESADGAFDATYDYAKVSITEPSPVKELQPGQYIIPGQDEPVSLPSGVDLDNVLQGQ